MIHAYIYRHLHVSELVMVEQDSVVWGILIHLGPHPFQTGRGHIPSTALVC